MENIRFLGKDIGHPAMQGLLEHVPDGLIITAGGADIWGRQDQFYFVSQQYVGNFDFKARLESLSRGDLYSKTGIMARESLQAGSKHVYLLAFPDNSPRNNNNGGFEFQYRSEEDGESKAIYPSNPTAMPPQFPVKFPNTWMRLKRSGDRFDSFYSPDGKEWTLYASFEMVLESKAWLGLAVTSHNEAETVRAMFKEITIL